MSSGANVNSYDVKYKVLLLGDTTVGKTSLQRYAAGKDFRPNIGSTIGKQSIVVDSACGSSIGVDFVNKIVPVEQAKVNLQIW